MLVAPRILKAPIGCRFSHFSEKGRVVRLKPDATSSAAGRDVDSARYASADPFGGGFDLVERDERRRSTRGRSTRGRANCSSS